MKSKFAMLNFLKYLMLLIISPAKGWEDVSLARLDSNRLFRYGFLPMIFICGLSASIRFLYIPGIDVWQSVIEGVVSIGAYFVTYFVAFFVFSGFATKWVEGDRVNTNHLSSFVIFNLSLLCLFEIIRNVIPVENALINFLPVFDILIMWKGDRFMHVKDEFIGYVMLLLIATILIPPTAIEWIFESFI